MLQQTRTPNFIEPSLARVLALIIGGIETVLLVVFAAVMLPSSDPLGAAIARGMTLMMALPYALLVLPGLIMAWHNRRPWIALLLVVAAIPVSAYLWQTA